MCSSFLLYSIIFFYICKPGLKEYVITMKIVSTLLAALRESLKISSRMSSVPKCCVSLNGE